ncbi:unnamed protein product [Ectocarpus sp. 6 AP-2014]
MQAVPESFLRRSTLGATRGFGLRLALLLLLLQQQLAEAVVPPRQHSSSCGFLLAPSRVHFNTGSSSASAASFFGMGASPSRTASSPSPEQRSGLLGKGVSGSNDDVVGDGYGAAGSSTRLQATAPTGNDIDPEDPSAAAAGLRSGDADGGIDAYLPIGTDSNGEASAKSKNDGLSGQILSIAVPALVALSVDPLMSAVDTAYIGRLAAEHGGGEIGLGALALNTNVFTFSFYIFNFLATVPTPFVASARAKGDEKGAARLIGQLLTAALALGVVLLVMLEFFGVHLLQLLGATAVNEDQARPIAGFLDTKTPLLIGLAANGLNFVLDPILIFQFGWGLQGAAIATVTAEWAGVMAFLVLLAQKEPSIRLRPVSLPKNREGWKEGSAVLTSSAAVFGRTVALQGALGTATAFAARVGPTAIAAHQVCNQLYLLLAFAADSLAVAAQGLVADRLGGGMVAEGREVAGRLIVFGLGLGVGTLVIFQVFGGVLPLIFTSDQKVIAAIAPIIAVVGLLQPLNGYVFVGDGILQGTQDFVYEALTMVVSATTLPLYIWLRGYLGGGETTLLDVWMALVVMQSCRSLTFTFRHFFDRRGPLYLGSTAAAAVSPKGEDAAAVGIGVVVDDGDRNVLGNDEEK